MKSQAEQLEELMLSRYERRADASVLPGVTDVEMSDASGIITGEETLVRQEFRDEVDVNTILQRFGVGNLGAFVNPRAMYLDLSGVTDYDSAVEKVAEIEGKFLALPPEIREKFDNNPGKLMEAVDKMTTDEFEKLLGTAPQPPVSGVEKEADGGGQ